MVIACWSGPRNISTAMLRSWGSRDDTYVTDEPLYAHYLLEHGLDHPGRDEIFSHHESDAEKVIAWLTGPVPDGKPLWYQKHMAHHLLPDVPRGWLDEVRHAFLIREPREMLASLARVLPNPQIEDTGLPQQLEILEREKDRSGRTPPIVDARDVLEDPRRILGALCDALGVPFQERMLSWPAGRRETDGVWAKHWYDSVERSTGFSPYRQKAVEVPEALHPVLDDATRCYHELHAQRLRP
ncbi:MAG TPA: HAD family hydrolase [Thermoanaerobaculia bacterium]|nr:HAD family hydrolase [Thermoanaerobaculia bacterium]